VRGSISTYDRTLRRTVKERDTCGVVHTTSLAERDVKRRLYAPYGVCHIGPPWEGGRPKCSSNDAFSPTVRTPPLVLAHLRHLMAARPLLAGVGPNGEHLEGAGQWSPRIRSADPACGGAPGAKRRCMSTEVVGNSTTDAADHGQHVRVEPNSGANAPRSTPQRLCLATQPLTWCRVPDLAQSTHRWP
jgi:hypothetical protein